MGVNVNKMRSKPADEGECIQLCRDILDSIDDVPDAGADFAAGVEETTEGIMATIEERGRATENQLKALRNMKAGLDKWLGDD